jgi:chemotaxis protein methyltransferase CheR
MEDLILKRIGGLIAAHSGIYVREQDYKTLAEKLWKRTKSIGLKSLEDYYSLLWKELEAGVDTSFRPTPVGVVAPQRSEWQELYSVLTVNESYFFRDKNQFHLLTHKLLPEILAQKQSQVQGSYQDKDSLLRQRLSPACASGVQAAQRGKNSILWLLC